MDFSGALKGKTSFPRAGRNITGGRMGPWRRHRTPTGPISWKRGDAAQLHAQSHTLLVSGIYDPSTDVTGGSRTQWRRWTSILGLIDIMPRAPSFAAGVPEGEWTVNRAARQLLVK